MIDVEEAKNKHHDSTFIIHIIKITQKITKDGSRGIGGMHPHQPKPYTLYSVPR